jgi:hypothetical protein
MLAEMEILQKVYNFSLRDPPFNLKVHVHGFFDLQNSYELCICFSLLDQLSRPIDGLLEPQNSYQFGTEGAVEYAVEHAVVHRGAIVFLEPLQSLSDNVDFHFHVYLNCENIDFHLSGPIDRLFDLQNSHNFCNQFCLAIFYKYEYPVLNNLKVHLHTHTHTGFLSFKLATILTIF